MHMQFSRALHDPLAPPPAITFAASGRFNVYRNNYLITLRNALRSTFPAVERLVGEEFFAALASAFAERHPPRSPIMAQYGDAFAGFLEQFSALADFPYLPDIARIEYARVQAYHAADAAGFVLDCEAALTAALEQPTRLHPSVHVVASAHPVHSIWQAQFGQQDTIQPSWIGETALVWRHLSFHAVEAMQIDSSERDIVAHLANGKSLATLLADCSDQQAATFLITKFLELASAGILVPAPTIEQGDNP